MLTASPPLDAPTREQMIKRRLSEDAPHVHDLDAAEDRRRLDDGGGRRHGHPRWRHERARRRRGEGGEGGKEVGPELTTIGKKYSRAQLLESILEPSKLIDPKYVTYLAEMDDGRLVNGLLLKKDDSEVVLKDAQDKEFRLPAKEIERLVPARQSLMPDLLLRDMTAEQVADLLAYLSSLK